MLGSKNIGYCFLFLLADMLGHVILAQSSGLNLMCKDPTMEDVLLNHPDNCWQYVRCENQNATVLECPDSIPVFSSKAGKCVEKLGAEDSCISENIVRECERIKPLTGHSMLIPHPTSCHRYFNCSNTLSHKKHNRFRLYEMECEQPKVWDINRKTCVASYTAECGVGRQRPKSNCSYITVICDGNVCRHCDTELQEQPCFAQRDGMYPYVTRTWTRYYIRCVSNQNELLACPLEKRTQSEQIFHSYLRKCMPLWEVPRKHNGMEPNCDSKFKGIYQLDGVSTVAYSCPDETLYFCKVAYSVHQDIDKCERMEKNKCKGGKWPHPKKLFTKHYIMCEPSIGVAKEFICPQRRGYDQIFNAKLRRCMSPWFIPSKYGGRMPSCDIRGPGEYPLENYNNLFYRCPGGEVFFCRAPVGDDDNIDYTIKKNTIKNPTNGTINYDTIVLAEGKVKTKVCVYESEMDTIIDINEICRDKLPGSKWSIPERHGSYRYIICNPLDGKLKIAEEKMCRQDMGRELVFDPMQMKCVFRWELNPEQGGYPINCDSTKSVMKSSNLFSYLCPTKIRYICNPPFYTKDKIIYCTRV